MFSTSSNQIHFRTFLSLVIPCKAQTLCPDYNPLSENESNIFMLRRGGKVAMAVALSTELPANAIEHLIVADIAPSNAALSTEFQAYVEAMKKIEHSEVNSRREAQDILALYESVSRH